MELELKRRKISVQEYEKMIDNGILTEDDSVELIHGEIIEMSPSNSFHSSYIDKLSHLIFKGLNDKNCIIRVQSQINLSNENSPEPDITLLKFKDDYYENAHPTGNDALLVIEVSLTTLLFDRNIKQSIYSKGNVPEYWIVNIENKPLKFILVLSETPTKRRRYLKKEK